MDMPTLSPHQTRCLGLIRDGSTGTFSDDERTLSIQPLGNLSTSEKIELDELIQSLSISEFSDVLVALTGVRLDEGVLNQLKAEF